MKNKLSFIIIIFGFLFLPRLVFSASSTLQVNPEDGTAKTDCRFVGNIILDTKGNTVNAAQVYLNHDFTKSGESFSLSGGATFSSYSEPQNLPSGANTGLVGYGNEVSGSELKFARFTAKSPNKITKNIKIHFDKQKSKTSKVAKDGDNILDSVIGGKVTVQQDYCETKSPNIVNLDPKPREPNHPTSSPIKFDLTDNVSGVDLATLEVIVEHDGSTTTYNNVSTELTTSKINSTDYSIKVNPTNNFTPQKRVDVTIKVKDKAGNNTKRKYYFNHITCKQLGCSGQKTITQCNDGKDNDNDGKIDMNDSGCSSPQDNNEFTPSQYKCTDGKDNDGDGKVDFADPGCQSEQETQTKTKTVTNTVIQTVTTSVTEDNGETKVVTRTISDVVTNTITKVVTRTKKVTQTEKVVETVTQTKEITNTKTKKLPDCNDGEDNDGDKLVDYPEDPGCDGKDDNSEFNQASSQQLSFSNLNFLTAGGEVSLEPNQARTIETLVGSDLVVQADLSELDKNISKVRLKVNESFYNMVYDTSLGQYTKSVNLNLSQGVYDSFIRVEYSDGSFESIPFSIQVQPSGEILGRNKDGSYIGLNQANINIQKQDQTGNFTNYQTLTTNKNGSFGIFVPNGTYRLQIKKDGYRSDTTAAFAVNNNIINRKIRLVKNVNLLDPNVSTQEKVQFVQDYSAKKIKETQELTDSPTVEKKAQENVAPAAAAATGAAVAPALGLINLLNYLRFLFFQPLLLLGRRNREDWGVVYGSLSRNPLDLVVVRLIDYETDEVVQSRVTDSDGRYIFFVEPGTYRIEIEKDDYDFPSSILEDVKEDGPYTDIYHGEPVKVEEENVAVSPNIPLDPEKSEEKQTPSRIKWDKIKKYIQKNLARIGIAAGIISLIISPSILVAALLAVQVGLYYLFKRLGTTPEPEDWGIVYESKEENPMEGVTVRLFTEERDKLVSTGLTDSKGRYSFLVGPNDYYLRFDKEGYKSKIKDVSIEEGEGVIEEEIHLDPKENFEQKDPEEDDLSFAE
jgi:hypothetical protein